MYNLKQESSKIIDCISISLNHILSYIQCLSELFVVLVMVSYLLNSLQHTTFVICPYLKKGNHESKLEKKKFLQIFLCMNFVIMFLSNNFHKTPKQFEMPHRICMQCKRHKLENLWMKRNFKST